MTRDIETYFIDGCMRCALGTTAACKVRTWPEALAALRSVAQSCGLVEEVKWGVPCYTLDGKNVLSISALKDAAVIGFFKGALLDDPSGLLVAPGPNSQAVRQAKFTTAAEVEAAQEALLSLIASAIEVEKAEKSIVFSPSPEPWPEELLSAFAEDPGFEAAFRALTPGRQRGYVLHFSSAKQSATRSSRIEKHRNAIFNGKGMHDDFKMRK
jgi:uncharacterized protein YdeI (YjbR/CyaY-like superfamily)